MIGRPCTDNVQRIGLVGVGIGPTCRLSIDGHNHRSVALRALSQFTQPGKQSLLKLSGFDDRENSANGVVSGNTVRQVDKLFQPILSFFAEVFDFRWAVRSPK